ncbi:MAG: DUF2061 domain-containing protein [Flavobacteriales bacterium]|nr:DUF2061 domain-containing protein [Flavobacteriales bacterium]MBL6873566.1 DUF2061 domain-containing protein [Flavobacteriales bacterium]
MKSSKRHIAKTISWRLVGTIDTLLLSWVITGDLFTGVKISALEVISKMILYYMHERVWFNSSVSDIKKRHLLKTFSWRLVGTLDTILIGWLISGNPFIGLKIGIAEVVTKMVLYYFHEKVWYKSNFGLQSRS